MQQFHQQSFSDLIRIDTICPSWKFSRAEMKAQSQCVGHLFLEECRRVLLLPCSSRVGDWPTIHIDKKLQELQEMQQTYHDISHCNLVHFASQRIISLLSSSLIYLRNLAGAELVQADVTRFGASPAALLVCKPATTPPGLPAVSSQNSDRLESILSIHLEPV